jgi:hypothetical protein
VKLVLSIFHVSFLCVERQKRPAPKGEDTEKKDEEEWELKDVVFVEDVKSVPVGMSYSLLGPCKGAHSSSYGQEITYRTPRFITLFTRVF